MYACMLKYAANCSCHSVTTDCVGILQASYRQPTSYSLSHTMLQQRPFSLASEYPSCSVLTKDWLHIPYNCVFANDCRESVTSQTQSQLYLVVNLVENNRLHRIVVLSIWQCYCIIKSAAAEYASMNPQSLCGSN
jgi:hypothetical protein